MIKDRLPILIADSMKSGNKVKLEALRAVKTAFMNWETAKENVGKSITDAVEISIVSKLVAQYEDTAKQCNDGKHDYRNMLQTMSPHSYRSHDRVSRLYKVPVEKQHKEH